MQQAQDYEARAAHAELQAQRARDEQERTAFLEIARLWRRLAANRYDALSDKGAESE